MKILWEKCPWATKVVINAKTNQYAWADEESYQYFNSMFTQKFNNSPYIFYTKYVKEEPIKPAETLLEFLKSNTTPEVYNQAMKHVLAYKLGLTDLGDNLIKEYLK
jgi:hypothetical protein